MRIHSSDIPLISTIHVLKTFINFTVIFYAHIYLTPISFQGVIYYFAISVVHRCSFLNEQHDATYKKSNDGENFRECGQTYKLF